jgi:hypothetical protein
VLEVYVEDGVCDEKFRLKGAGLQETVVVTGANEVFLGFNVVGQGCIKPEEAPVREEEIVIEMVGGRGKGGKVLLEKENIVREGANFECNKVQRACLVRKVAVNCVFDEKV